MMDAAARILLQKLGNRTLRAGRFKEFKVNSTHGKKRGADLLRSDFFAPFAFQSQRFFIVGHGLIQRWDGDPEMVNFCDHSLNSPGSRRSPPTEFARRKRR